MPFVICVPRGKLALIIFITLCLCPYLFQGDTFGIICPWDETAKLDIIGTTHRGTRTHTLMKTNLLKEFQWPVCVRFARKSMSKPHYLILQCILPHEPLFPSAPCRWVFATHRCASWTHFIVEISTPSRHRVSHCLFQLQQQTLSMCWGRLPPDHDIDWPHISPVILLNVIRPPIVVFHLDHSWSIACAHWSLWRRQHL